MKLEDQVASLDLCKRLKELGVKQESLFYYAMYEGKVVPVYRNQLILDGIKLDDLVSAFTVAELGEALKRTKIIPYWNGIWWRTEIAGSEIVADNEADVRAKILIYLIENGIVKIVGEKP